jgi:hypothetical protein
MVQGGDGGTEMGDGEARSCPRSGELQVGHSPARLGQCSQRKTAAAGSAGLKLPAVGARFPLL